MGSLKQHKVGRRALDQGLEDPDPRPLPPHVSLMSLGPATSHRSLKQHSPSLCTDTTFQLSEHLHDSSPPFLTSLVQWAGYRRGEGVSPFCRQGSERFGDLPEFTQMGGDTATIEPRILSPACLGYPLEYGEVCETVREHTVELADGWWGIQQEGQQHRRGVTLLSCSHSPSTKASEGTIVWVDSCQLKEGWSLASQIKMFSDSVDSIQKTFIEALSQSRFSTGGRISKQK